MERTEQELLESVRERVRRPLSSSPVMLRVGIGVIAIGFAALGVTWIRVALTVVVGRQMPLLVSGGFGGLGLIMTGHLVVTAALRRQHDERSARDMDRLIGVMSEIRRRLDSGEDR